MEETLVSRWCATGTFQHGSDQASTMIRRRQLLSMFTAVATYHLPGTIYGTPYLQSADQDKNCVHRIQPTTWGIYCYPTSKKRDESYHDQYQSMICAASPPRSHRFLSGSGSRWRQRAVSIRGDGAAGAAAVPLCVIAIGDGAIASFNSTGSAIIVVGHPCWVAGGVAGRGGRGCRVPCCWCRLCQNHLQKTKVVTHENN